MALKSHILVVDDNTWNLDLILQTLLQQEYIVSVANSGKQALEYIHSQQFDLVLLDIMLSDCDGITILKEIRARHSPTELPVIVVTDIKQSERIAGVLSLGASDYVTKPIDTSILMARVKSLLCLVDSHRELALLTEKVENRNEFVLKLFNRYLSRKTSATGKKSVDAQRLGGELNKLTILYADICNFKQICATLATQDVVTMLNNYFEAITAVIQKYHGVVDQFIGYGTLVTFGAEAAGKLDVENALACALEMQLAMNEINAKNKLCGFPEISIGIGVNSGEVMVGGIVAEEQTNFSVLGKHVNFTVYMESFANPREILISHDTYTEIGNHVHVIGSDKISQVGFDRITKIYSICGIRGKYNLTLNKISRQKNRKLINQTRSA